MKTVRRFLAVLLVTLPALAQAHPGHDGHELTWDFHGHGLWDNPLTFIIGGLCAGALAWRFAQKRR
jgi:urease accessory protein